MIQILSDISDALIDNSSYTYEITEDSFMQVTPYLTCSENGLVSIFYSLILWNGYIVPEWVKINPFTGELNITSPNVANNAEFSFCINSLIVGNSNSVQNLITIKVLKCTMPNCQKCSSSTICASCISNYILLNSSWIPHNPPVISTESKSMSITINSSILSTTILESVSTILSISSLSSLWSMINQIQLLLLNFPLFTSIKI